MSLRTMAFCAALLLAAAGVAVAQNEPPNEGYGAGQYPSPVYDPPQYANNQAYQIGLQDGINDGVRDRQSNHSFRPTKTEKYEDADSGYTSSLGDKDQYKAIYRQGYTVGYQQGYSGQVGAGPYPVYGPPQAPVYGPPQAPVYGPPQVYGQSPYGANPGYQNGFQSGLNEGTADRQAGRQFRATDTMDYKFAPGYRKEYGDKDQYKQAYRQGYATGYQQAYSGAAAPVGAYPPAQAPVYGQPYPYPQQYPVAGQPGQAYQIGYQDGLNDGAADRQAGRGFRATKTEHYEDAPGYNKSFGDKKQWKNIYRQGYVAGYQQAFGH